MRTAKRVFSDLLSFVLLLSLIGAMPLSAKAADVGPISFGITYPGTITADNASDKYTVILAQPGKLSVSITSDGGLTRAAVKWLNSSGAQIDSSSSASFPYNKSIDLEAGTYYIEISRYTSSYTGAYTLWAGFSPAGNNEIEPNNTRESAQPLTPDQPVKGFISYQDNVDVYKCVLPVPGKLTVDITSDGGLTRAAVKWLDSNGAQIDSSSSASFPYNKSIDLEAGTYYIEISRYTSSYTGTYILQTGFSPAGNNEIEPNNTRESAQSLTPNQTVKGFISYQDNVDLYKCVLTQTGKLSVNITSDGGLTRAAVKWLDSGGAQIDSSSSASFPYNRSIDLEVGTYYIEISRYTSSYTGAYTLQTGFGAAGNNEIESNNTRESAQPLTPNQTVKGFISYQDSVDLYKCVLTQTGKLSVNITSDGGLTRADIRWLDVNGAPISSSSYASFPHNREMDLNAGTYYIEVSRSSSSYTGTYNLTVTFPSSSQLFTVTFNANGGSVSPSSALTGTNGRLTTLPTPTRSGYTFNGWYTSATGGTQVTTSRVYTANTTIYARWISAGSGYTINFNANGGSVTPASAQTGTNGRLSSLPTPTRNGYTFNGWYTSATGGAQVTTSQVYTQNTTVYAHWTKLNPPKGVGVEVMVIVKTSPTVQVTIAIFLNNNAIYQGTFPK